MCRIELYKLAPGAPASFQERDQHIRDFRVAKAMAQNLRAALAAKVSKSPCQSLELIAKAFSVADRNSLAAAVRCARSPLARTAARAAERTYVAAVGRAEEAVERGRS